MIRAKWIVVALSVICLILLWQIKCNTPKAPADTSIADSIKALNLRIANINKDHKIRQEADNRAKDSMKAVIMVLQDRLKLSTADFEKEGKKAVEYNRLYKIAKQQRDTLMIFENCDSMSVKVDAAEQKYQVVKNQNDSLKSELVIAESTYQVAVSNCLIDYDLLKKETEKKDALRIKENEAALATVKKQKRKGVWAFLKGLGLGFLLDEIKNLFTR